MKLLYPLLLVFLFVSCHTARIKKVPVEVVSVPQNNEVKKSVILHRETHTPELNYETNSTDKNSSVTASTDPHFVLNNVQPTALERNSFSEDEPEVDRTKIVAAFRAERQAKTGSRVLTGALVISLISWIFIPLLVISLTLIIIGAVQYSKANRSQYITQEGEVYLKRSRKLLWTTSIIAGLIFIAYGILIGLFLL